MEPIKILMLGGRRCGKTSALASMFNQLKTGDANRFFTITNATELKRDVISPITGRKERQDSLEAKIEELKHFFGVPEEDDEFDRREGIFLVDASPTYCIWRYKLRFKDPNEGMDIFNHHHFDVEFIDIPGEYCRPFDPHENYKKATGESSDAIKKMMEQLAFESDVALVIIDTPYLMAEDEALCEAVNCPLTIKDFITRIRGDKAKLIMFVHIKCEKWIKEGNVESVYSKIQEVYKPIITDFSGLGYAKTNVCITPIETAGNILFAEMKKAYLLTRSGKNEKIRCCQVQEGLLRLENGKSYVKSDADDLNPDPFAKISGSKFSRKYSWFCLPQKKREWKFAPHNCDNMALHVLQFIVAKYSQEGPNAWGKFFGGGITKERMKEIISKIEDAGLLDNDVSCIKYLQKRFDPQI